MKTITKTTAVRKADSSLDATLNPVELSSKEIVSWAIAFPRPGAGTPPVTRVEDSTPVQATRAALEEGNVPGGGVALLNAVESINVDEFEGDEKTDAQIIRRALEEPIRQLAENAGLGRVFSVPGPSAHAS
jgi:hypothetical protein